MKIGTVIFILIICLILIQLNISVAYSNTRVNCTLQEKIEIKPQASFKISERVPFLFQFNYSPDREGLPPGSFFEIILPQRFPLPFRPRMNPKLKLNTKRYPTGVYLKTDPFYSTLSAYESGSTERVFIEFEKGLEPDESITLEKRINIIYSFYTHSNPFIKTKVIIKLHKKNESPRTIDTPEWIIKPTKANHMIMSCPSQAEIGEEVPLVINFTSLVGRSAVEDIGKILIEPNENMKIFPGLSIDISKKDAGLKLLKASFTKPGVYRIFAKSQNGFKAKSNPIVVGEKKWDDIYWGNLHSHTNYSWDHRNYLNSNQYPEELIREARERYLLDFIAVTDHGQHDIVIEGLRGMDPLVPTGDISLSDWGHYNREILNNKVKDIIAYVGYEQRDERGDTVMLSPQEAPYFIVDGKRLDFRHIWERSASNELISIPHLHPQKGRIDLFKPSSPHETLVEIASFHGSFEYYQCQQPYRTCLKERLEIQPFTKHFNKMGPFVRDLLDFGKRFGIIGSEDHGFPGYMGLTGLFCSKKDRDIIFDSLLAKRTYATSGNKMIIYFDCGGMLMGEEAVLDGSSAALESRSFNIEIYGEGIVKTLDVVRNGHIIKTYDVNSFDFKTVFCDKDNLKDISLVRPADGSTTTCYYLRIIQEDGHMGWFSPVFYILEDQES